MGGQSKKATIVKMLATNPAWPALVAESGNLLFKNDTLSPESLAPAKIVAEGVLQATTALGGAFAGIGSRDLAAGESFLRRHHHPPAFSWLSLNVVDPAQGKPLFVPVLFKQVGQARVAIFALTDHAPFTRPNGSFRVAPWQEVLPKALASIEGKADFIVLLSNYDLTINKEIANTCTSLDLILQSGHVIGNMQPLLIEHTLIAQTETKGRYLGVLDIQWQGHGRWSEDGRPPAGLAKDETPSIFAHRFIPITPSTADDPAIEAIVQQTKVNLDKAAKSNKAQNERAQPSN